MILALDIGTSGLKGGIFDNRGRLISRASFPVALLDGSPAGFYEVEPQSWIIALGRVCRSLTDRGDADVRVLVVSGNGPTLAAVDKRGKSLYPAITWIDRRGMDEAREILTRKGAPSTPSFYLAKAYWLLRERPEIYSRTGAFLGCPEYVIHYLCGNPSTILPSPLYRDLIWPEEAMGALGLDRAKFPSFFRTGERVGALRDTVARDLGLKTGTPVVAGGPDFLMSLLGTATVSPGATCDRAGSSEGINHCSKRPVEDTRLLCLPHIVDGYHNVSGVISTTGKALDWFCDISGYNRGNYQELFEAILGAEPGSGKLIFLPYLTGERSPIWDPYARGAFVGLTLRHTRSDLARAVAESIGYAIRDVLDVICESGFSIDSLRVAGSQARSGVLNQLKADITGKKILVPAVVDSELMGDACVGLVFMGEYESFKEASMECVKMEAEYLPRREYQKLYSEMFYLYRRLYSNLKEIFYSLSL